MTHEELLAKIDWIGETKNAESGTATPLVVAVLASLNALRAVVELHQPIWTFPEGSNNSIPICLQCRDGEFESDYPCRTIQAIEKELK